MEEGKALETMSFQFLIFQINVENVTRWLLDWELHFEVVETVDVDSDFPLGYIIIKSRS